MTRRPRPFPLPNTLALQHTRCRIPLPNILLPRTWDDPDTRVAHPEHPRVLEARNSLRHCHRGPLLPCRRAGLCGRCCIRGAKQLCVGQVLGGEWHDRGECTRDGAVQRALVREYLCSRVGWAIAEGRRKVVRGIYEGQPGIGGGTRPRAHDPACRTTGYAAGRHSLRLSKRRVLCGCCQSGHAQQRDDRSVRRLISYIVRKADENIIGRYFSGTYLELRRRR